MRLARIILYAAGSSAAFSESGSYRNPNPRPYDDCEAADLIHLSACCNDVLSSLDDCKAGDLACECCALQSMDRECYNLCPGNPSANFLSVLLTDCVPLNDVNACNIPFKKVDGERKSAHRHRNGDKILPASANILSSLAEASWEEEEEEVKPKPKINLIYTNSSAFKMSSKATSTWKGDMVTAGVAAVLAWIIIH